MTATYPTQGGVSEETDPVFVSEGATADDLADAITTLNTAIGLKQASATAATDTELAALDAAIGAALADLEDLLDDEETARIVADALKQDASTAATDAELTAAIAAHAAGDATDAELSAAVSTLNSALALKQDASTAATDAELAAAIAAHAAGDATDAELAAAVASLQSNIDAKQDAATAATDAELASGLAGKQDASTAATDTEVANAVSAHDSDAGAHAALFAAIETGPPVRDTDGHTTASLANNASEDATFTLAPTAAVLKVETDVPARVVLYDTDAHRDADVARAFGTDPSGNHGVQLDLLTTALILAWDRAPAVVVSNGDVSPSRDIYARITNVSGSADTVTVTITYVAMET